MKRLRKGQEVDVLTGGNSANAKVYKFLLGLEVGELAIINTEDWAAKTPLSHTIHNTPALKGKFKCKTLADQSGWLCERIAL